MNLHKLKIFFKRIFCNHLQYDEGWFVQQVKVRKCKNCELTEIQDINGFTKILNS